MDATEMYAKRRKEIDREIARIRGALLEMDREQKENPHNWGYPGEVGHALEELSEVLADFTKPMLVTDI